MRTASGVVGAYLAAALAFTWPLTLHPVSQLASVQGPGDSYLNLWILGWDLKVLSSAPSALFTGAIFNAPIFHPVAGALAFSDHLVGQALILLPVYLATHDAVLCYNLLFLLSLVASAAAMHALVRGVVGRGPWTWVAGLAWGFWPFHFAHLIHVQLQALYVLPLAFLALHRVVAGRRRPDAVWLGVALAAQAIATVYYGVIGAIGLAIGAIALAAAVGRLRDLRLWRRFALAMVVAAVLVAPVAWMYWRVQQREGFGRNLFEADRGAAALASYVQAPPTNLLYGATGLLRYEPRGGSPWTGVRIGPEQELWPGVVLLLLAVLGAWRARRRDARPTVVAMLAVAAAGWLLSLGPGGVRPIYAAVHATVFGFQAIRAPARFGVLVVFACAVLAALGVREWLRPRTREGARHAAPALLLVALIAVEYLNVPIPYVPAPPRHTPVGEWLRAAEGPGAVVYLPMGLDIESTSAMLQTLEHGRSIVNGYSGQRPSFYPAVVDATSTFPSAEALAALKELGVRFVVSAASVEAGAPTPLVERARFGRTTIYELVWTPEAMAALDARDVLAPPPPGPIPFAPGERAVYEVKWVGGPLDLAAGTATLLVGGPPYRLTMEVETAPWLSRFFEARDRYTTYADRMLWPEIAERHQRQGRRASDRVFVFDPAAHAVRAGTTIEDARRPGQMTLPLAPHARDALTTFYYVRTLPLAPGFTATMPINDAGRNLRLDIEVAGEETVTAGGRPVPTWRLRPRIAERVPRRAPLEIVVWITRDARRIPVAFEVTGGFGTVRAELVAFSR